MTLHIAVTNLESVKYGIQVVCVRGFKSGECELLRGHPCAMTHFDRRKPLPPRGSHLGMFRFRKQKGQNKKAWLPMTACHAGVLLSMFKLNSWTTWSVQVSQLSLYFLDRIASFSRSFEILKYSNTTAFSQAEMSWNLFHFMTEGILNIFRKYTFRYGTTKMAFFDKKVPQRCFLSRCGFFSETM